MKRLHFEEGQLFDPDTGEVWARNVRPEFGQKLRALPALADALENLLECVPADARFTVPLAAARAALTLAGRRPQ